MAKTGKKSESGSAEKGLTTRAAQAPTLWDEMDRWFDHLAASSWLRPRLEWPPWTEQRMPFGGRLPRVDLIDREHELVLKAELPGVDKKDLDVSMTDTTVTLKGSTAHEEKEEKGDYYRSEMSRGSFSRTLSLPCAVDQAKVQASFKDGVLELTMPKVSEAKRKRVDVR